MKEFNLELAKQLTQDAEANEFSVDFDFLWEWCGYSKKSHAKESLKKNFEDGLDYIEQEPHQRQSVNHASFSPQEQASNARTQKIWTTPDCAKEFGMLAKTEQGKQVRKYFIHAEKELRRSITENPKTHLEYLRDVLEEQIKQERILKLTQEKVDNHDNILEQHQETIDTTANELESVKEKLESYRSNPNFQNYKLTINKFCRNKGIEADAGDSRSAGRKLTKLCNVLEIDFDELGNGRSNEYPYWLLEAVLESANDFRMPVEDFVRRCLQCYIDD